METDTIPSHWPVLFNALDGLIVPCSWNASVFAAGGVTVPVGVIPHVAELPGTVEPYDVLGAMGVDDETFVVATLGEWTARKDPGLVVRAYLEAFRSTDPVVLIVKTSARTWLGDLETPGPRCGYSDWELVNPVLKRVTVSLIR